MNLNIPFLKFRSIAIVFSALLIIASVVSFFTRGIAVGLDFAGGTTIQVKYTQPVELDSIRSILMASQLEGGVVQYFGSTADVTIRLPADVGVSTGVENDKLDAVVMHALQAQRDDVILVRKAFVGPAVGDELREQGGMALLVALMCIMVYVAIRFEWKFALGSVAALAHDVIIVTGFFSITQIEFDLTVLAAILAVIGYSLNDTIVVYDRIRENFLKMRKGSAEEIVDRSLNHTFTRTLMTSLTTLLVLLALFIFGGELIHAFAIALIVGVFIGTYSSIYVASVVALVLGVSKEDLMPPEIDKEGADQDALM